MRILSYNIQIGAKSAHNPSWSPELFDLESIAQLIESQNPDIVGCQEVDRWVHRSSEVDQARWLGERLGMHWVHGASLKRGDGVYGNLLLSKYPILDSQVYPLPVRQERLPGEADWVREPRSALVSRVDIQGEVWHVIVTHLSTTDDQQTKQAERLVELLADLPDPVVLMGDFNAEPSSAAIQRLSRGLVDGLAGTGAALTYPNGPQAQVSIDRIWLRGLRPLEAKVIVEPVGISDHNPVFAVVQRGVDG